jgi:four helix bundle protein
MKENIILNKSIDFSIATIKYCKVLYRDKQVIIADQLSRSAMSIGANVSEAQQAESRSDFIHKIKVAAKEAWETQYWLTLCKRLNEKEFHNELTDNIHQIIAILSKIIVTTKMKM